MDKIIDHHAKESWQFDYVIKQEVVEDQQKKVDQLNDEVMASLNNEHPGVEQQHIDEEIPASEVTAPSITLAFIDHDSQPVRGKRKRPSEDEEWASTDHPKRSKKIKKYNPYPTKNFLPVFKPFILGYLHQHYKDYHSHNLIKRLTAKKSISMNDFQQLFNDPILRPIMRVYFKEEKKIHRDLLQSRLNYKRKRQYFKRIDVFEHAYDKGSFTAINKPLLQSS